MAGDEATIDLTGVIGWDMNACDFVDLIDQAKKSGASSLTLRINSVGGMCYDGEAMGDALLNCGMKTHAVVCGTAQSMASYLLQCCDTREANPSATIMVHQPSAALHGPVDELRELANHMCLQRDRMFDRMAKRMNMTGAELSAAHVTMKMYTAGQAKAAGMLDIITGEGEDKVPEDVGQPATMTGPRIRMYGECNGIFDLAMQGFEDDEEEEEDDPKPESAGETAKKGPAEEQQKEGGEPGKVEEGAAQGQQETSPAEQGGITPEMQALIDRAVAEGLAAAKVQVEAGAMAALGVPAGQLPHQGGAPQQGGAAPKMSTDEFERLPWWERAKACAENRY